VTRFDQVDPDGTLAGAVRLLLDAGCLHGLSMADRTGWATTVVSTAAPAATLLVRAAPAARRGIGPAGIDVQQITELLPNGWHPGDRHGSWYRYDRRAPQRAAWKPSRYACRSSPIRPPNNAPPRLALLPRVAWSGTTCKLGRPTLLDVRTPRGRSDPTTILNNHVAGRACGRHVATAAASPRRSRGRIARAVGRRRRRWNAPSSSPRRRAPRARRCAAPIRRR